MEGTVNRASVQDYAWTQKWRLSWISMDALEPSGVSKDRYTSNDMRVLGYVHLT